MQVPFHRPSISDDEIRAVTEVLAAGWLTAGKKTAEFETAFSHFVGSPHAVAVNSATSALHLALAVAGVREGDEVLVPAMTFTSTAGAVRYLGARPVLVDIERDTHLMNAGKIEERITERTRAIIPVHYGGQPCDMDALCGIAHSMGLSVIEDAAHSLPARYRGRAIGSVGDFTCFSFYATKTVTTGEGGMICTADGERAARMRRLRTHGIDRDAWSRLESARSWQYDVAELGYKYNTTDIAAAMGIEQLKRAEAMREARRRIAGRYDAAFHGVPGLDLYVVRPDRESAWHLYPLRLDLDRLAIGRDRFFEELEGRGVGVSVHFIPLYEFTYFKGLGYDGAGCDDCRWVFERTLSLPIFPAMGDGEIDHVAGSVLDIVKRYRK
ncbi:MAG: DegT/DnrJ/EryC1/StrS aminotransferase family protein [Spirochaetes bacterium]|nr:DegT/DnrJ/EryC1/StrS aminotransferase family protein [Spirochaetota bacterium]